jgi:hypothetical protein
MMFDNPMSQRSEVADSKAPAQGIYQPPKQQPQYYSAAYDKEDEEEEGHGKKFSSTFFHFTSRIYLLRL